MIVKGYQTLEDKDNIYHVELHGPFPCESNSKGAWLGLGCYLWDTNYDWALGWGRTSYKTKGKDFYIGECKVDLSENCFDLFGCVKDQTAFVEVLELMSSSNKIKKISDKIVPNVIEFMKNQNIFPYSSVRSCDYPPNNIKTLNFNSKRTEYTILNQRVQICVISKKDVILPPFLVIYPEN